MRRFFLAALLLTFLCPRAEAQQSVVEKYRQLYPTPMGVENTVTLLKQVAAEVKGGLLKKPTGNNCLGYSCDVICFSDGRGFDVLSDSEGAARPTWSLLEGNFADRCELVTSPGNGGGTNPPPPPDPQANLEEVVLHLKNLEQLLLAMRMEQSYQTQQLEKALADLRAEIQKGVLIRFR